MLPFTTFAYGSASGVWAARKSRLVNTLLRTEPENELIRARFIHSSTNQFAVGYLKGARVKGLGAGRIRKPHCSGGQPLVRLCGSPFLVYDGAGNS